MKYQHIPENDDDALQPWIDLHNRGETPMTSQQTMECEMDRAEQEAINRHLDSYKGLRWFVYYGVLTLIAMSALWWWTNAEAQTAPTFTCTNTTGSSPLSTSCTWNVPGATACTASGMSGWTGSVPITGTRNLTGIIVDVTLKLDCTGPGKAVLNWIAPTTNTDGSTLTNLAGYTALYGVSATTLVSTVQINNPVLNTYTIDSLAAGTWFFSLRARASNGAESANSNVVSKAVAASTFSLAVPIDVTAVPSPPSNLTVTDPTAMEIRPNSTGTLVAARVGLVSVGTRCYADERKVGPTTYNGVPIELVDFVNWPQAANLREAWARCGA